MKIPKLVVLLLVLGGCASTAPVASVPSAGSVAADREACEAEAVASLYPAAMVAPTPTQRTYPWTAARDWPQNAEVERLRERDLIEACMAQRGHRTTER